MEVDIESWLGFWSSTHMTLSVDDTMGIMVVEGHAIAARRPDTNVRVFDGRR